MKKIIIAMWLAVGCVAPSQAQRYTDHLQQSRPGMGKVTITQSKEVERVVNGTDVEIKQITAPQVKKTTPATPQNSKTAPDSGKNKTTEHPAGVAKSGSAAPQPKHNEANTRQNETANRHNETANTRPNEAPARHNEATQTPPSTEENEMNIPTIDLRKKVMRGSKKVNGYRVQAFAGGNKRADKIKAQNIGNSIKMRYPDEPIYVHFYSPRWICRVGNYRTYEQAAQMLKNIRAMGIKGATIVQGKITVQY